MVRLVRHPAELSDYLERCLAAPTLADLREAAVRLPATLPVDVAWLGETDETGRLRIAGPGLTPDQRSVLERPGAAHPLLPPRDREPRALSAVAGAASPIGLADELMIPLSLARPTAVLMLGREAGTFSPEDLVTAGLIQAVLGAAYRRVAYREPMHRAQGVARQELRSHARTLVLLVDPDGRLQGDGADQLSAEARLQLEALLGGPGGRAAEDGAAEPREIMLVRNAGDVTSGLMSLKVLPPDADGISSVLVRLPADAAHLEAHGLSSRQAEVMAQVLAGVDPAEISRRLDISPATVRKHTENAYRTLGVRSLTEFALRVL